MQTAGPELLDFSKESPATLEMYGVNKEPTRPFATNCLLARRLVERGTRFVMMMHASWDDHTKLNINLKTQALSFETQWAKAKSANTANHPDIFVEYWWLIFGAVGGFGSIAPS